MTSVFYRTARDEIKAGAKVDETLEKYNKMALSMGVSSLMSEAEEEKLKAMEVKTMKKATRRVIGIGNNARYANIHSYTMNGLKNAKKLTRKTPKVSDCKVFKLVKGDSVWVFRVISDTEVEITTSSGLISVRATSVARHWYKGLVESGFKRADEKPAEEKPAKPCKTKASSKKQTEKQTTKKSKKTDSKKASKRTKKASTKKETTKKASKGGVKETAKKETKAKKESAKVFILEKGAETRHHNSKTYRFTVTKNRGILIRWNGNYKYCTTEEARWMYKNLLNDGYKRVA